MKTHVKQITFSEPMVKQIESTVREKGITFPEFIRHLVLSYYEGEENHVATKRTEERAIDALQNFDKATHTQDVAKFLKSL